MAQVICEKCFFFFQCLSSLGHTYFSPSPFVRKQTQGSFAIILESLLQKGRNVLTLLVPLGWTLILDVERVF